MKPIEICFADSSDPEACRKAYVLGYRAGYRDGRNDAPDITREGYDDENILREPIEAMQLSTRGYNSLIRVGCRCVGDVVNLPASKIRYMRNMGKKTAAEIIQALKAYGITDTEWEYAWLTD